MHWLYPAFLAGAAAVALPILLHLLRRRPRRTVPFPTLRFLRATQPQNDRAQRLRRWLVLLGRCAALALLAAAFARPFVGAVAAQEHRATVLVVDNSFSLQAANRWSAVRAWAANRLRAGAADDQVGILVLAPRPTWVVPVSTPRDAALARLQSLEPGWDTARAEVGLRLAAQTLAGIPAEQRNLLFLTDHQQVTWTGCNFAKPLAPGVEIAFPPPAEPVRRQAALGAATVLRPGDTFHLRVPVRSFTGPQTRQLRVYRDGGLTPVAQTEFRLGELENRVVELDVPAAANAGSAWFRIALDPDDLPADDTSYAVWQSAGERAVLLDPAPANSPIDYVATAFAVTENVKPSLRPSPLPSGAWPAQAVVVLRNDASFAGEMGERLAAFVRGGGTALLFATGGPAEAAWLGTQAAVAVRPLTSAAAPYELRDWTLDHPLVSALGAHRATALVGWQFRRGWSLPVQAVAPLALWSTDAAAIGEKPLGAGRLILCGFTADRRDGDWPVRESFVPFLHRTVAYLIGGDTSTPPKAFRVNQPIPLGGLTGEWVALDGPGRGRPPATLTSVATAALPGVYAFSSNGTRQLFAVNLPPEESDLAAWQPGTPWDGLRNPAPAPRPAGGRALTSEVEAEQRNGLWWWPVAGVAVLVLAELGIANQTSR